MENLVITSRQFYSLLKLINGHSKISSVTFKGHGQSMSPFIRNGNTICLKLIRMKDRIRIGDIVAVRQKNPDKIFIHRVIGIKEKKIQVKGDNRKVPDGWFPVHSIIGIVTKIKNTYGNIAVKIPLINPVIAFLSRTGILYRVLLPLARWTKQGIKNRVVNG